MIVKPVTVQHLLLVIMFWMVLVTVKSWCPTTPSLFHDYLSNSKWILSKTLDYSYGGYSGTFCGEAFFANIGHEEYQSLLHYTENGMAELCNGNTVSARQQLIYSFVDPAIVSVYFFDDPYHDHEQNDGVESMIRHGRFFHHIRFDETNNNQPPVLSSHPCGPDIYHGRLAFETSDFFTVHWKVTGPRKEGNIVSSYVRKP